MSDSFQFFDDASSQKKAMVRELNARAGADSSIELDMDTDGERSRGSSCSSRVVMVAVNASGKESGSQAGVEFAMEQGGLNRGDSLVIFAVSESKQKLTADATHESTNRYAWKTEKTVWRSLPAGLELRCAKEGVELVVSVQCAPRGEVELAVCRKAMQLRASHVVLAASLKSRNRRRFYGTNLSCDVTRMRQRGGVDVVVRRLGPNLPSLLSLDDRTELSAAQGRSPAVAASTSTPSRTNRTDCKRRLPSSEDETHAPVGASKSLEYCERRSSESSVNKPSFASPHDDGDDDEGGDLFSIFHGSGRHTDATAIAIASNTNPSSNPIFLGYESDDLFTIADASMTDG